MSRVLAATKYKLLFLSCCNRRKQFVQKLYFGKYLHISSEMNSLLSTKLENNCTIVLNRNQSVCCSYRRNPFSVFTKWKQAQSLIRNKCFFKSIEYDFYAMSEGMRGRLETGKQGNSEIWKYKRDDLKLDFLLNHSYYYPQDNPHTFTVYPFYSWYVNESMPILLSYEWVFHKSSEVQSLAPLVHKPPRARTQNDPQCITDVWMCVWQTEMHHM